MKRVYSFLSLVMAVVLTCAASITYAQCDNDTFIYGGKSSGHKAAGDETVKLRHIAKEFHGFGIAFADYVCS